MKILGHTSGGYIVEMTRTEMQIISGVDESIYAHPKHHHGAGAEVEIYKTWDALRPIAASSSLIYSEAVRLREIANSLDCVGELVKRCGESSAP